MLTSNKNDELAKTAKNLMLKEPFYGLFLLTLNKLWSDRVPTAGVTLENINYSLLLNEEFWAKTPPERRIGLLQHELLHIAFFHLTSFAHLSRINAEVANIAEDLEINQYIDRDTLPEGGMFIDLFPELNLEPKKGTMYYFEKLLQASQNKGTCPNLDDMLAAGDGVTVDLNGGRQVQTPDHSTWDTINELNDAHKGLLDSQLKHILNEVADQVVKSRGTVPGEMQQILDKINEVEPPKFDWRGYIRRFTTGSISLYTKMSRRKPNRRIDGLPAVKVKKRKHILVAIDTSGSVSNDELVEFIQEIHHIYKTGAYITVAHADTAISHIAPYNPKDDWEIHGRGGTDFTPVVDYYNENLEKYTCLIYLTDGEAPQPENKPKGRVLWVLSTKSKETDHLPGHTVQLN